MSTFNKLAGASTLKKNASNDDDPISRSIDRVKANLTEMVKPTRLEKGASIERIRTIGDEVRRDIDSIKQTVDAQLSDIARQNRERQREMFKARPFTLDPRDPRAVEIIGDAVRANPGLLNKLTN